MEILGIHDEVRAAFLPRTARVAGRVLHAPCMGHVLAMSVHAPGILGQSVPAAQVAAAAAILSMSPAEIAASGGEVAPAALHAGGRLPAATLRGLLDAILGFFAEAFGCDVRAGESAAPSGLGWWLELYYFAAATLGMAHGEILACPLSRLCALSTAGAAFNGMKFREPSYAERCTLRELGDPPAQEAAP